MGKASKKKNQKKQQEIAAEQVEVSWEDLLEYKDKMSETIMQYHVLTSGCYQMYKDKIDQSVDLTNMIKGLFGTLEDFAIKARKVMEMHVTFDKDNKVTDWKKGKLDPQSEEFFSFLSVTGQYLDLLDKLQPITSSVFYNIFTSLGVDKESEEFKQFSSIAKDFNEAKTEMNFDLTGSVDGKQPTE